MVKVVRNKCCLREYCIKDLTEWQFGKSLIPNPLFLLQLTYSPCSLQ